MTVRVLRLRLKRLESDFLRVGGFNLSAGLLNFNLSEKELLKLVRITRPSSVLVIRKLRVGVVKRSENQEKVQ